ncbi:MULTISPECIES: hypothetical protein [unclassified Nocardia]|uniref:hypothetical protein n=1 Tax=unclassified Nocardia TaxID=2637762 RepID=UPI00278C0610|nr:MULTISPECIES: hypothetical protein [unclassified Nocardia]
MADAEPSGRAWIVQVGRGAGRLEMLGSRIARALADGRDEILDKLPRLADVAAVNPLRRVSNGLRGAARSITGADADGMWSVRRESGHWAVAAQRSTPEHILGRGNAGFVAARADYTTRAQRRLYADPRAAAEIGREFRYDLHQAYLHTRTHRSPEKAAEREREAHYEAVRGWFAVTHGFRMDLVIRSALSTARGRAARGQPVAPLPAGGNAGTAAHSVEGLEDAVAELLRKDADEFWDQTRPGGRYAEFQAEWLRSAVFDEHVKDRWYADFERAITASGRTQYASRDKFFGGMEAFDNRDKLDSSLKEQAEQSARMAALFEYADPSLSPASKLDLFQRSIPALAEWTMLPKSAFQRFAGPFMHELSTGASKSETMRATARTALNLAPDDPVRPLEPRGLTSIGHCPAPNLTSADGTPAGAAVLELAALVAPETLWRPR